MGAAVAGAFVVTARSRYRGVWRNVVIAEMLRALSTYGALAGAGIQRWTTAAGNAQRLKAVLDELHATLEHTAEIETIAHSCGPTIDTSTEIESR